MEQIRNYRECSVGEGLEEYQQAVETRLLSHHFTQQFELMQDPRDQDTWNTWVEYLCYIYWFQDQYAALLPGERDKYQKACYALAYKEWEWPYIDELIGKAEWNIIKTDIRKRYEAVETFLKETRKYMNADKMVARQELRASWVRGKIIQIAAERDESIAQHAAEARSSKKRKYTAGTENLQEDVKDTGQADEERPCKRTHVSTHKPLRRSARLAANKNPRV